jgi:hypothetical protein
MAESKPLIESHISDVSVGVIQRHIKSFREFLGHKKTGIYVLRKGEDVYYIGLAGSLRSRLPQHMKDHHKGKWDRFELYALLKSKVKYLDDLEAVLIRVAKPKGNKAEPKFVRHHNRTKEFKKALVKETAGLFLGNQN